MTQEQINNINELMNENARCLSFIKDYILRFRFADLASHTKNNESHITGTAKISSTEKVVGDYEVDAEKIISEYEKEIERICNKDNIMSYCENDQLLSLKKELDNAKKRAFNKIISQYNSIEKYDMTSGVSSDFMLYTFYMEYIMSDNFIYDENNPYVVELLHKLSTYINTRSKIELNRSNIEALIIEFNKMCDESIKQYWSKDKKDYFSEIKEIFKYDFYANSQTDLIEATISDDDRITLYSKVLDYLKILTHYVEPIGASEKYTNIDTDTLINMGADQQTSSEKAEAEKLKKLKRISLSFTALKRIESDTETSYFSEYIDEQNLNDALTLKSKIESSNQTIDEIATSTTYTNKQHQEILKKYIGALENLTKRESEELREICDRAIQWYTENSHRIDDGSIFDDLNEVNWSKPTTIYRNNIPYDFYYIEKKKSPSDEMNDAINGNEDLGILKDYDFNEDSLRTKYGIDSYRYWLRYCTVATLVNCMLPMYWSTGLIAMGAPVKLPIIFIPIIVLTSRVIVVIGIGLCGICPMPMLLLMNVSDIPGFAIPALNMAVDTLKDMSSIIMNLGKTSAKEIIKGLIAQEDDNINRLNEEMRLMEQEIHNFKNGIKEDSDVMRSLMKMNGEDTTSKRKRKKNKRS